MALTEVFVSVIHGRTTDCRQANSELREKLMNYNFRSYITEKECFKCPNNACNTAFLFILQKDEYFRLKNQVQFDVRPTFFLSSSLKSLMSLDRHIRKEAAERNTIGIQACPETANAVVDACPPSKVTYVQTDFMVGKKDNRVQTEEQTSADMACQVDLEPDKTTAVVPYLPTSSSTKAPITPVANSNSNTSPDSRASQPTVARGNSELQQRIPVIINQVIQQPPSVMNLIENDLTTSTDGSDQDSPIRSLEVQQDDESEDVVFIEIRRRATSGPTIREVKVEEPEEIEQPQPETVATREIKEEPIEEPAAQEPVETEEPENPVVDSLSNKFSSADLTTPKRTASRESTLERSAKRLKFSEIEICDKCMAVTEFSSLKDYCAHVLDVHITLVRFKCKVCPLRFFDLNRAIHHVQKHPSATEDKTPTFEEIIEKNIPEDNFARFIRIANQCYPDKFRNIPTDQLMEIIHDLP